MENQPQIETPKEPGQAIAPTTWQGWIRETVGNATISTKKGYYLTLQKQKQGQE